MNDCEIDIWRAIRPKVRASIDRNTFNQDWKWVKYYARGLFNELARKSIPDVFVRARVWGIIEERISKEISYREYGINGMEATPRQADGVLSVGRV